MARRSTPRPEAHPANLSAQQIRAAIPKLERRIKELKEFDSTTLTDVGDPKAASLCDKVDSTLVEIYGPDSLEYRRYQIGSLYEGPMVMSTIWGETPRSEIVAGYRDGLNRAIAQLQTAFDLLQERLQDMGEAPGGRAMQAFSGLDLHPEIERAAGDLYRDRHYANAIEDAVKALSALVKLRSGRSDLDGSDLMKTVFSKKNPVLAFNALASRSDEDEQEGMMMLFAGAVTGLRNPRAHDFVQDDPERAMEFIAFISLLAKLLDTAKNSRPPSP